MAKNCLDMKYLFFIATIIISSNVWSQDSTKNLKECIEYAEQKNITIKQQNIAAEIQHNNYKQSKYDILPNLNAGSDYNMTFGRAVDPYTNEFSENNASSSNLYINSSVTLFEGFKKKNTISKSKLTYLAALQDAEKTRNDIALNIATAYLQILFNKELVLIAEKQMESTKKQIERIKKLVAAGKSAESDLTDILAQAANEQFQLVQAQNNLKDSYILLLQLMDLKTEEQFEIEVPTIDSSIISMDYTIDELFQTAQSMPEIKAAEYRKEASLKDISIAKSAYYPSLTAAFNYATGFSDARQLYEYGDSISSPIGYVGNTGNIVYSVMPTYNNVDYKIQDQLIDNRSQSISFRLSIPIFNQYRIRTQVQNTTLYAEQAELSAKQTENSLYKEIQTALAKAESAQAKFISSKKAVEANRKAFKNAENRFKLGLIDSYMYNQAKIQLTSSESEYLRSKYDLMFRQKILDFYAGKTLF